MVVPQCNIKLYHIMHENNAIMQEEMVELTTNGYLKVHLENEYQKFRHIKFCFMG